MVILTTLRLSSGTQVNSVSSSSFVFFYFLTPSISLSSASTPPHITDEQEEFIRRVLDIPLEQRRCRDLITLDTLHLYCGGPEPTPEARRLDKLGRHHEYIFSLIILVGFCSYRLPS